MFVIGDKRVKKSIRDERVNLISFSEHKFENKIYIAFIWSNENIFSFNI